ncbi:MAG: TolC family protein, partial [Gemmatimonadota bacterium]|nr:TolC family protein [Gemmatimonadota bacterium]
LDDAIRIARGNNPTFLSTANDVSDAAWQVREAYGQFLPSFTVGGSGRYEASGVQRFGVIDLGETSDTYLSSYFAQLNYQLDGNTFFQAKSARANRTATEARVTAAEYTLESEVTVQYLAALRAREAVDVAERQVARWEENFELVSARVTAGAALSTDGKQAEVDLGRAQVALLQAENLYRTELARLMEQMGQEVDRSIELASDFGVFEPDWDRDSLIQMAMAQHPSLRAFVAAEAATGAQVNQARSGYFPSLTASATWSGFAQKIGNEEFLLTQSEGNLAGQRASCEQFNALEAGLPGGLPNYTPQDCTQFVMTPERERQILAQNSLFPFDFTKQPLSVQLTVRLPVFSGFSRQRQVAQAQAFNRDAIHNRRAEELRIHTAVTQSYDDLVTAYRSLQIQERNLEVASEQLELARQRYGFGAAAFLELLDAEDSMAQAERDHLAAVYDFHQSMWALEAAVGVGLRPDEAGGRDEPQSGG